jgi:hypothetical protein
LLIEGKSAAVLDNLEPAPKVTPPKDWRPAVEFDGTLGEATTPPTTGNQPNFDEFLIEQGFDPQKIEIYGPIRTSRWQQREGGDWLVSWRFNFRTRSEVEIDLPTLYANTRKGIKVAKPKETLEKAVVVCWSDTQTGKAGDIRGGTPELIERIAEKQANLASYLKKEKPDVIYFLNVGDSIEGFESGGNPMRTNDLSLMQQVDLEATFEWETLKLMANYAPIVAASVGSNHCAWRSGRQKLGTSHDDWGIHIQRQLARLAQETDLPVKFYEPQANDESLALDVWGDNEMILGLVHGHQASRPDGIVQWWRNQSHGNQPVKDADILIHGHFHHLTVKESGRRNNHSRWVIQCPTLDAGSSWYRTGMGGDDSDPGLLVFPLTKGENFQGTVYKL